MIESPPAHSYNPPAERTVPQDETNAEESKALSQIPVDDEIEEHPCDEGTETTNERRAARWRWVGRFALGAIVLGLGTVAVLSYEWAGKAVRELDAFRLTELELAGDAQKVPVDRMRSAIEPVLSGNFFTADLEAVRRAAETVPWVKRATVRRIWPSGLRIDVEVHRAMALYEDGRLVSTEGVLFSANPEEQTDGATLPYFYGSAVQIERIARNYQRFREIVGAIPAQISDIQYSDRESWSIVMQNDWMPPTRVELGRDDPNRSVEVRLQDVVDSYPQVVKLMKGPPSSIDARYPGAFAAGIPDAAAVRKHFKEVAERRAAAVEPPVAEVPPEDSADDSGDDAGTVENLERAPLGDDASPSNPAPATLSAG